MTHWDFKCKPVSYSAFFFPLIIAKICNACIILCRQTHQIEFEHFAWLRFSNKEDFLFCLFICESDKCLMRCKQLSRGLALQWKFHNNFLVVISINHSWDSSGIFDTEINKADVRERITKQLECQTILLIVNSTAVVGFFQSLGDTYKFNFSSSCQLGFLKYAFHWFSQSSYWGPSTNCVCNA